MNNDDNNDYVDNNIKFSCPFQFPQDEPTNLQELSDTRFHDFIFKFSILLLNSNNSKETLVSVLYASGYDVGMLLGTDNTISALSKILGVSRQNLSLQIFNAASELNIKQYNTGKDSEKKKSYKKTNYKRL